MIRDIALNDVMSNVTIELYGVVLFILYTTTLYSMSDKLN